MIENPVKSPIVPPIAERISTNLAARSLVTLSKLDVSNSILTNFNLGLTSSKSKHYEFIDVKKYMNIYLLILNCKNLYNSNTLLTNFQSNLELLYSWKILGFEN